MVAEPTRRNERASRAREHDIKVLYALLDKWSEIAFPHLRAALAVWNYSSASARWVWGDALGDPTADELFELLRAHPEGRTATEIRDHFGRHRSADVVRARSVLLANGLGALCLGANRRPSRLSQL